MGKKLMELLDNYRLKNLQRKINRLTNTRVKRIYNIIDTNSSNIKFEDMYIIRTYNKLYETSKSVIFNELEDKVNALNRINRIKGGTIVPIKELTIGDKDIIKYINGDVLYNL